MKLCSHPMCIIDNRTNHLHYEYMSKSKVKVQSKREKNRKGDSGGSQNNFCLGFAISG